MYHERFMREAIAMVNHPLLELSAPTPVGCNWLTRVRVTG